MKVYFSAPRNTPYQSAFIEDCVERIRQAGFEVFSASDPYIHQQAAFEVTTELDGKPLYSDENQAGRLARSPFAREVFKENYAELASAEALVALLDGSQVDDRVACEIGIFYGLMRGDPRKQGILGFATDARCLRRRDSTYGVNIFTLGTLEEVGQVVEDFKQVLEKLKEWKY
jgi:nucleoside 2-deoxyribosyltransferase